MYTRTMRSSTTFDLVLLGNFSSVTPSWAGCAKSEPSRTVVAVIFVQADAFLLLYQQCKTLKRPSIMEKSVIK